MNTKQMKELLNLLEDMRVQAVQLVIGYTNSSSTIKDMEELEARSVRLEETLKQEIAASEIIDKILHEGSSNGKI